MTLARLAAVTIYHDMPTCSFCNADRHDVAHHWSRNRVDGDNHEMTAIAIIRLTCASCGEPKDARFDDMKKEDMRHN